MTTTWDPTLVSPELLALTRLLGEPHRDLAVLAEGNTSERLADGRLVVKASGANLSAATADDFVIVDVDEVMAVVDSPTATQDDLTALLVAGGTERADGGGPRRGSIETVVHAAVHAAGQALGAPAGRLLGLVEDELGSPWRQPEKKVGRAGGGSDPRSPNWLSGARTAQDEFKIGPFTTRPKNLTPDNQTGIGRFSDRQIFNALRYGLRPEETPDVEIASTVPGQGNFPLHPHFLAIPMPWPSWRHMPDKDLWAIAAYLKDGVKPVRNVVKDSEGPPDFWAGYYVPDTIGTYPAAPFPTANEKSR